MCIWSFDDVRAGVCETYAEGKRQGNAEEGVTCKRCMWEKSGVIIHASMLHV